MYVSRDKPRLKFPGIVILRTQDICSEVHRWPHVVLQYVHPSIIVKMAGEEIAVFDEKSKIWLYPFSEIINCMFPAEYIYGDWFWWQGRTTARQLDPESLASAATNEIETGSRVEGFCIPQFLVSKTDEDFSRIPLNQRERWEPDFDGMKAHDHFIKDENGEIIPIFTTEHDSDDPRYVHLRFTDEWKEYRPRYKNATFVNHAYLFPSSYEGKYLDHFNEGRKENEKFTYNIHGPVRKLEAKGLLGYEEDNTSVFKYPTAWPEQGMEWLVRSRPSGWPSPELVQNIFESGCHLAPVGRGKRQSDPIDLLLYQKSPEQSSSGRQSTENESTEIMDETEWRLSFSVAENKLGRSVSPVQRHVLVLLKIIKKAYFSGLISSYFLKNLLFWEIEKQDHQFWRESNSAGCLLFMLDRLQECLEGRRLPHYITPQSNLLGNEDPAKLDEAVAIISDIRTNIMIKTISILKRCLSMTYLSASFMKDIDVAIETILPKMQDSTLERVSHLTCSLLDIFKEKTRGVVEEMIRCIRISEDENIKELMHIPLYAYQSLLARILCKLWYLEHGANNNENQESEEFIVFVQKQIKGHYLDDEFIELILRFFGCIKTGKETSLLIPESSSIEHIQRIQMAEAQRQFDKCQAPIKDILKSIRVSDLQQITQKVSEKFQGCLENLTMDNIEMEVNKEIMAKLLEPKQE